MNSITKDITLGFYDEIGLSTIYARQSDTERKVCFQLIDEMAAYVVEDTTYIVFKETYSDGTIMAPHVLDDYELSDDGSQLTINLTANMLACTGVNRCELVFVKSDGVPHWDDHGHIVSDGSQILSTTPFNIYVEGSVYNGGCLSAADNQAISELVPLVIAAQDIIHHDEEYQQNEQIRISNENTRISNESGRIKNETRITALNDGGTYIDPDTGQMVIVKNKYTNRQGEEIEVDVHDLQNMSYVALAGYMKYLSDEDYYPRLSESYAHGQSGLEERPHEDTDNAMYYYNKSAENKAATDELYQETLNVRNSIDEALEETTPHVYLDPETGHLMYTGGRFSFAVNEDDGHLYWSIT